MKQQNKPTVIYLPKQISPEFELEVFKKHLELFIKYEFEACDTFFEQLKSCDNTRKISKLFIKYNEDVVENLHWECDGECDACYDLEREKNTEIKELEYDIKDLEKELKGGAKNLADEYKFEAFMRNKDKYSLMDFEELLKNGFVNSRM